jgi:hypothetical protein
MTLTFQSATSSRSLTPLDLQSIFWRSSSGKLPKDITSITGFQQSIGGKVPVLQKNANGSITGNKEKNMKRVEVRFKFKGLAVIRESTVTLSGSVPWEMIYRVLARLVPEVKSLTFTVTNTAERFYLKKRVRLEAIANEKLSGPGYTLSYEPELYFARIVIRFKSGIVASVFSNGTVVAQGKNLKGIESKVRGVLSQYSKPYGEDVVGTPVPARKNLKKKRLNMTEARYEPAKSWTNTRKGFYVRPGPDKVPRFYKVPANPALVRQKVLRAYSNIGVNVPPMVKYLLGISANAAVKPKTASKNALNWNANVPNGMYIRPGPGGLPKLYKIPKLITQGRKTVIQTYKKAGINIPSKVKTIFGIVNASPMKSVSMKTNVNNKGKFRIDGLDCMRYTLPKLQAIATRLGIPIVRQTKTQLCMAIRKKTAVAGASASHSSLKPNFVTANGVKHYILANERRVKRNTRTKAMNSFKVNELVNMIRQLNSTANTSKKSKKELIELLIERKLTMRAINNLFNNFSNSNSNRPSPVSVRTPSPSPAKKPSPGPPSPKKRNPLNIARNIIGNGFTNYELKNFLNKYMLLPSTSKGTVSKMEYKKLVKAFKNRRAIRERLEKSPPRKTGPLLTKGVVVESM